MNNSKFIKEMNLIERKKIDSLGELYKNIEYVKSNLECFYANINIEENDIIYYYIYRIIAEEAKYDYLIRLAKLQENKAN